MSRSLLTLSLLFLVTVVGIARSVLAGNPVVQGHEGEMNIARRGRRRWVRPSPR